MAVGQACNAVFWPTAGLKQNKNTTQNVHYSVISAEGGALISASPVGRQEAHILLHVSKQRNMFAKKLQR